MQDILNGYGAGVEIRLVQLQKVDPPQQVIDAFRDVQAARQDQDRARNEAETYASQGRARRREARRPASCRRRKPIASAVVAEAHGQASRFNAGLRGVPQGARRDPRTHVSSRRWSACSAGSTRSSSTRRTAGRASCPICRSTSSQRRPAPGSAPGSDAMSSTLRMVGVLVARASSPSLLFGSTFIVQQTAVGAGASSFGQVARPPITEPGLYFKVPADRDRRR